MATRGCIVGVPMKIAVIGVGQTLRGDDGAGLAAVQLWQQRFPETARRPEVDACTCELPGLTLLDLLEGADFGILVDAVQSGAPAGTIHELSPQDLAAFGSEAQSAHGWGIAETLMLDAQLNHSHPPVPVRLIGIEVACVNLGDGLSPAVQNALARAAEDIEEEVQLLLMVEQTAPL